MFQGPRHNRGPCSWTDKLACHMKLLIIAQALTVSMMLTGACAAADKTARMVHYSGQVQGVGFRLATVRIARDYPVTGWVKNLKDGRVQLVVEGPEEGVDKFLKAVREFWKKNIEKEE